MGKASQGSGVLQSIIGSLAGMACTAIAVSVFVRSDNALKQRVHEQFSTLLDSTEKLLTWYAGRVERKIDDASVSSDPDDLEDRWADVERKLRS